MNKRFEPWLLLPLLLLPQTAMAQTIRQVPLRFRPPSPKQSHRCYDLPAIVDLAGAQEMLSQRLQELHEGYDLYQWNAQVQELLKDHAFRDRLQELAKLDWQQFQKRLLTEEGLNKDRNWAQLFQQMDQRKFDMLRRLVESNERQAPSSPSHGMPNGLGFVAPPPAVDALGSSALPPSLPIPVAAGPSLVDQLKDETAKWLIEEFDAMGVDVLQALTEASGSERNTPLVELLRSAPQPDFASNGRPPIPSLPSETLARYLTNGDDFFHRQNGLWESMSSLFRRAPPSLPSFDSPSVSLSPSSTAGGDGWAPVLLSLVMLATVVLLLYRSGFGPKSPELGVGAEWRPGPWPTPPHAVATRQDVIRAFEYLALLRLGPAAAACHHRQLAERLAQQDADNPARRQAAEILAWLYEQARYAPAEETLSAEQLSDARQALCSLAGVTAP
jgi:hypothetical protein